jgi:hypothetical protein
MSPFDAVLLAHTRGQKARHRYYFQGKNLRKPLKSFTCDFKFQHGIKGNFPFLLVD